MQPLLNFLDGRLPARRSAPPEHVLPAEPPEPSKRLVEARMQVSQPLALLGFKDASPVDRGPALLARRISAGLALSLLFDRTAPLYQELYDAGLVDEDFSASYASERGFGYAAAGGRTKDPLRLRDRILAGIKKARPDREALRRAKRKALGGYLRLFDQPQSLASALVSGHFQDLPLLDYPARLEACRGADVARALAECLDPDRHALSVIWPEGRH